MSSPSSRLTTFSGESVGVALLVAVASPAGELYDVVVVGGGPAGIGAALSAANVGAKTALVERDSVIGGTTVQAKVCDMGLFSAWKRQIIAGPAWDLVTNAVAAAHGTLPDFAAQRPDKWMASCVLRPARPGVVHGDGAGGRRRRRARRGKALRSSRCPACGHKGQAFRDRSYRSISGQKTVAVANGEKGACACWCGTWAIRRGERDIGTTKAVEGLTVNCK